MLCTVCGLANLSNRQVKYCSKPCERKGWRDSNKEKLLAGKKRYREKNKDRVNAYHRMYRSQVESISSNFSKRLRELYSCLRCGTNNNLQVHHIKHQLLGGGANDPNNLVVLCKDCHALWHKMFDTRYWKINGTSAPVEYESEQIVFLNKKPIVILDKAYPKPIDIPPEDRYKLPEGVQSIIPKL